MASALCSPQVPPRTVGPLLLRVHRHSVQAGAGPWAGVEAWLSGEQQLCWLSEGSFCWCGSALCSAVRRCGSHGASVLGTRAGGGAGAVGTSEDFARVCVSSLNTSFRYCVEQMETCCLSERERKGLVSLGLGAAKGTGMEGGEPSGLPGPKAAAPVSPQGDPLGGSPVPSLTISLGFLCFPPLSMRQAQALGTSLFSSPQDLGSEEPLEERGSAAMASRSHLQQEGPLEASDDYRCAICLDNISNMACVDPCFHRFCSGCIRRWATTRAVCPLCRQPIDRVLHTVRADDDYQEYVVGGSSSRWQRRRARERSRSRSPLRQRQSGNNGLPVRRNSTGSGQVSRADAAPSAPAASTSGEQSPPSTAERIVSPGDGASVRIGALQLPPLRIQLPNRRAQ